MSDCTQISANSDTAQIADPDPIYMDETYTPRHVLGQMGSGLNPMGGSLDPLFVFRGIFQFRQNDYCNPCHFSCMKASPLSLGYVLGWTWGYVMKKLEFRKKNLNMKKRALLRHKDLVGYLLSNLLHMIWAISLEKSGFGRFYPRARPTES